MSDVAIRVENLSKLYRIGATQERHDTLRDAVTGLFRRRPSSLAPRPSDTDLWALKDVTFEVKQGEVVGVIGRNGAGKSTLLKILSRITEPTSGRVALQGRVASLLEVGTGFHPELTGRENVYLNGAILGMKRREIDRKFDEIVAFAEIERFLDTPVKRYSSGMYVRLAFAVAAHLESEILLVDEVLAVGDSAFQKKCLGKMGEVANEGRTVLMVSHNMAAVRRLCPETILFDRGQIGCYGETRAAIGRYLSDHDENTGEYVAVTRDLAPGDERFRLMRVSVMNQRGRSVSLVGNESPFVIEIEYHISRPLGDLRVGYRLLAVDGTVVLTSGDTDPDGQGVWRDAGRYVSRCLIPANLLNEGEYYITVACDKPMREVLLLEESIVSFKVQLSGGVGGAIQDRRLGVVRVPLSWHIITKNGTPENATA